MKIYALRLKPNQDLKKELIQFSRDKNIQAGAILTCVGSLKKATLRFADSETIKTFDEKFEIVSLTGTFSQNGVHLHLSLSNQIGQVTGGHLKAGCIIYTTAEIIVGDILNLSFFREFDPGTQYKELNISPRT